MFVYGSGLGTGLGSGRAVLVIILMGETSAQAKSKPVWPDQCSEFKPNYSSKKNKIKPNSGWAFSEVGLGLCLILEAQSSRVRFVRALIGSHFRGPSEIRTGIELGC